MEPQNLYRIDGRRPDGLTLVLWERGTSLIWDFTCIDRLSPSYTNDALYAGPKVAEKAEDRKRATYNTLQRDYIFEPVAVETLGGYGPSTTVFLKKLSKRLRVATLEERAGAFFRQRLGIAVQVGNAASILFNLTAENAIPEEF